MTPQDVLRKARELIVEKGWANTASGSISADKPYCVGLAMIDASRFYSNNDHELRMETFRIFCEANDLRFKAMPEAGPYSFTHDVYEWNDSVCDGGTGAIAAIDKALAATLPPVPDVSFLDDVEFDIDDVDARELATVS